MDGNYSKKIEQVNDFDVNRFTDIEKRCIEVECGNTFIYTAGEQKYYLDRMMKDPARCKECRNARRLEKMKNAKY